MIDILDDKIRYNDKRSSFGDFCKTSRIFQGHLPFLLTKAKVKLGQSGTYSV